MIVWHVEICLGNPDEKVSRKQLKQICWNGKKTIKIYSNFRKNISSKCSRERRVQIWQTCRSFPKLARNFSPNVGTDFVQSPKTLEKCLKGIFNRKCFFGRVKCKSDETARTSNESPKQSTLMSQNRYGLIHFFKTIFYPICPSGRKNAVLIMLPKSCSQKSDSFLLTSRNGWRFKAFFSDQ